jgi:hypothetical protein
VSQTVPLGFTFDPPEEVSAVDDVDWSDGRSDDDDDDDDDTVDGFVDIIVDDDDNVTSFIDGNNDLSSSQLPPSPTVLTARVTRWPAPSKVTPLVDAPYYIPY